MPKDPKDPINYGRSRSRITRPVRYTRPLPPPIPPEELLSQGDLTSQGAPLQEISLVKSIAIPMLINEICKFYPEGLPNSPGLESDLNRMFTIYPGGLPNSFGLEPDLDWMVEIPADDLQNTPGLESELNWVFDRLAKYNILGTSGFLTALQIIDRLSGHDIIELKNQYTPLEICTAALMLATKYIDDIPYNNKSWHQAADIPLLKLNEMEAIMLKILDFQPFDRALTQQKAALYQHELSKLAPPPRPSF